LKWGKDLFRTEFRLGQICPNDMPLHQKDTKRTTQPRKQKKDIDVHTHSSGHATGKNAGPEAQELDRPKGETKGRKQEVP